MILDEDYCATDRISGACTIDLRTIYGNLSGLLRILPWRNHLRLERRARSGWAQDDAAFDYLISSPEMDEHPPEHPLRRLADAIPGWAREAVRPFRMNQLRLLRILSFDLRALELARDAPVLFWLMAECLRSQSTREEILVLTSIKRREILRRTIGASSKSMLKFLSKLEGFSYEFLDLERLRSLLKTDEWTRLRHLDRVNWQVLNLFANEGGWFEYKAVRALMNDADTARALNVARDWRRLELDIRRLTRTLGLSEPTRQIKMMADIEALRRFHDVLVASLNNQRRTSFEEQYREPFPNPPFPGNERIQPINCAGDLLDEGSAMHHCVASYAERILQRKCYIYRILTPERATLELLAMPDGKWRIGQIKLACNRNPAIDTLLYVRMWLETEKAKTSPSVIGGRPNGY